MDLNSEQEWSVELFHKKMHEMPLNTLAPEKLSQFFNELPIFSKSQVMLDTEHGIDGTYCEGSCEVWNVEEFSPWQISQAVTVIMGNLTYIDDKYESGKSKQNLADLEISNGAKVFVSGNLSLGSLLITNGQLHCSGEVNVTHNFLINSQSYVSAKKITTNALGVFGEVNCKSINHISEIKSEVDGLSLRSRHQNRT
jgi:hypothetical protein